MQLLLCESKHQHFRLCRALAGKQQHDLAADLHIASPSCPTSADHRNTSNSSTSRHASRSSNNSATGRHAWSSSCDYDANKHGRNANTPTCDVAGLPMALLGDGLQHQERRPPSPSALLPPPAPPLLQCSSTFMCST